MDSDITKVHTLNSGKAPRDLDYLLAKHTASGRLRFTASYGEAADFTDLHFIGVGTPNQTSADAHDLIHLADAARRLAPGLTRPAAIAAQVHRPGRHPTQGLLDPALV
ncbi:hypothetical protein ACIQVR_31710 [Streptomyces xanthochromogenes]|uniref:hypothetical protein n=1 Tax=Streptomyces xanthochromogenes TaxID=67384 RepID=UPI003825C43C